MFRGRALHSCPSLRLRSGAQLGHKCAMLLRTDTFLRKPTPWTTSTSETDVGSDGQYSTELRQKRDFGTWLWRYSGIDAHFHAYKNVGGKTAPAASRDTVCNNGASDLAKRQKSFIAAAAHSDPISGQIG